MNKLKEERRIYLLDTTNTLEKERRKNRTKEKKRITV